MPALASASDPGHEAWVSAALTFQGLKALGVPQDSLDSFPREFQQGMAARASLLGDTGESAPENWEKPLGTQDVHVAISAIWRLDWVTELQPERASVIPITQKKMANNGKTGRTG